MYEQGWFYTTVLRASLPGLGTAVPGLALFPVSGLSRRQTLVHYLHQVADLALMVYLTNYLLIPRLLYKKRYWLFALLFITLVFTFSILQDYVQLQQLRKDNQYEVGIEVGAAVKGFRIELRCRIYYNDEVYHLPYLSQRCHASTHYTIHTNA